MKKTAFIIPALLFSILCLNGQEHSHHHERNEIGISGGAIYAPDHKEWGSGVHIHYYRTLSDESRWSIGAMAEMAWVDGAHTTLGIGAKYQICDRFSVGILPGVTMMDADEWHHHSNGDVDHIEKEFQFSIHGELTYDLFHWDNFHLGPVLDYSWSKDDAHMMLGVHGAFCF